jgi:hypothetical protein
MLSGSLFFEQFHLPMSHISLLEQNCGRYAKFVSIILASMRHRTADLHQRTRVIHRRELS